MLSSLRTFISSLVSNDAAFAMKVSQTYRTTNAKVLCNDRTFMATQPFGDRVVFRAHEDDEEKRKQKNASLAMAAFTQKGSGKDKAKPICRDYVS